MKKYASVVIFALMFSMGACCKKENTVIHHPKESPDLLAMINGKPLYEKDMDIKYRTRLYQTKKQLVDAYMKENLLNEYMKKKGYTQKEFFEKEIVNKVGEPSEKEIKAFYDERQIKQPYEQIKSNIASAIKNQKMRERQMKFFDDLQKGSTVVYYFSRPTVEIELTDKEISTGPKDAPVTMVEYTEFKCPFCRKSQSTIDEVMNKYKGKVRLVFRNFPLPNHAFSREAANAAYCADEQGKFWAYKDVLFEKQQEISEKNLLSWAENLKMDMSKFKKCYSEKKYDDLITRDVESAKTYGVNSTPTFYVNGVAIVGAQPTEEFEAVIDEELAKAKKK